MARKTEKIGATPHETPADIIFQSAEGKLILERDQSKGWRETTGPSKAAEAAAGIGEASEAIKKVAIEIGEKVSSISERLRPDEISVELKLSFKGEGNAWIVKASGEAQLSLKLLWKKN